MSLKNTFLLIVLASATAFAQVPPGDPYDPAKHPNPIVTYVTSNDFKASTYDDAQDDAGFDLLGLSQSEGKRESIVIAPGAIRKTKIGSANVEVTYYSVVRQTFKLTGGSELVLHSFKFPKLGMRPDVARMVLNQAALEKKKNPREMRFGGIESPEELDIRGRNALLFEKDGVITVYWEEDGIGHTATAKMGRRELFRIIEDLL